MSGFFGVASKRDCVLDLFFGVDYHSHLGTRRAGMTVHGETGFNRAIHNIQNSPFRTKFERDIEEFHGNLGIGCISDNEAQPLLVNSHLGSFAITTVGRINNLESLKALCFNKGTSHFLEMSSGEINPTELVAALINHKQSIVEGISYVQEMVESEEAITMARRIIAEEAIFAGMSSGAAMLAAARTAKKIERGNIVVIFPDRAEKYLSTGMFAEIGED